MKVAGLLPLISKAKQMHFTFNLNVALPLTTEGGREREEECQTSDLCLFQVTSFSSPEVFLQWQGLFQIPRQ